MKLILKRTYFNDATIGQLWIDGLDNPVWHTIERPWLENKQNESCIPESSYTVKPYSSDKYPDVWEVQDVPNRTKILIHKGNWSQDVKGCIAVGLSQGYIGGVKAVLSSSDALKAIKDKLNYPSEFELIVRS